MATVIGRIATTLSLDSAKYQAGMKAAARSMRNFGTVTAQVGKRLFQFGALAGAAATAGLVVLTKRSFSAIDVTAKLSRSLHIATEDIETLNLAAKFAGLSQQEMTKSLQQLTRRLGDAQDGTGEYAEAIQKLGLDAKEMAKVGLMEAFRRIADELPTLTNRMEQADVAYQLLGRSGIKLLNVLDLGREGLKQVGETARKAGLQFSLFNASKVENANDAIERMGSLFTGVGNQIAINLAPFVTFIADEIFAWGTAGGGAAKKIKSAFDFIPTLAREVLSIGLGFTLAAQEARFAWAETFATLKIGLLSIKALAEKTGLFAGSRAISRAILGAAGFGISSDPLRNAIEDLTALKAATINARQEFEGLLVNSDSGVSGWIKGVAAGLEKLEAIANKAARVMSPLRRLSLDAINDTQAALAGRAAATRNVISEAILKGSAAEQQLTFKLQRSGEIAIQQSQLRVQQQSKRTLTEMLTELRNLGDRSSGVTTVEIV